MALKDKLITLEDLKAVHDVDAEEITGIKADLDNLEPGLSEDAKRALLECFRNVAWTGDDGRDYYDALESSLYPNTGLTSISAVFSQNGVVVYPSTPLNSLKDYLVVTGHYAGGTTKVISDYALSGVLSIGNSTITVTKEGKTATFTVNVSAPYWDYEWYSASGTLPDGMTSTEYNFSEEPGVLYVKHPNLDLDYVGDCKIFVEMKCYNVDRYGNVAYKGSNNPQITILNSVVDETHKHGVKMIFATSLGTSNEHAMVGVGINGTNALVQDSNGSEYHTYELTAVDNVYSFLLDGEPVALSQNQNTTQYIDFTGIATALPGTSETRYDSAFIKSIKFKRL